jgi:hypothetical protein
MTPAWRAAWRKATPLIERLQSLISSLILWKLSIKGSKGVMRPLLLSKSKYIKDEATEESKGRLGVIAEAQNASRNYV